MTFDGCGDSDVFKVEASRIVYCAIDDEVDYRGHAELTETLGCFLEFRIEQALRAYLGNDWAAAQRI